MQHLVERLPLVVQQETMVNILNQLVVELHGNHSLHSEQETHSLHLLVKLHLVLVTLLTFLMYL